MSNETKFEHGDQAWWNSFDTRNEFGREGRVAFPGPELTCIDWDGGGHSCSVDLKDLSRVAPTRVTSADQIRDGARYELGGMKFKGDRGHLIGESLPHGFHAWAVAELLNAGAVITEIALPPEPEWRAGDWIEDAVDRLFFYAPNRPNDPAPFRPLYPKDEDEYDFFPRAGMKGPLKLHYRHGEES